MSAEDRGAEIVAREGGDDEAARFGSGAMGVQLRTKLSEMSRRFGLAEGADEGACRVVAVALQERIASMIEDLRPAVRQRTNSAKHAFGQDAFTKGTDPKLSWKVRAAQPNTDFVSKQRCKQRCAHASGWGVRCSRDSYVQLG